MNLSFMTLHERHYGITPGVSAYYAEAAAVCLARHHSPPTTMSVRDNEQRFSASVDWPPPSTREQLAHLNSIDATEAGAYCLALAAIEATRGLIAVSRTETLTGADYYLAPLDQNQEDLENTIRLEVSGTDEGNASVIEGRLRKKMDQAAAGQSNLPAVAAVVGFRELTLVAQDVAK